VAETLAALLGDVLDPGFSAERSDRTTERHSSPLSSETHVGDTPGAATGSAALGALRANNPS
jgi:hypothetical protein